MRWFAGLLMMVTLLVPTPSASAVAGTLGTATDLVVDVPHGRAFASGYDDRGRGRVQVSDLRASHVAELAIDSPAAMAKSPDGTAVLVAQDDAGSIASIDASSLAVTTVALSPRYCPRDVAVVDGEVWIVSRCFGSDTLAVVDMATGSVTPVTTALDLDGYDTELLASPQLPGSVFVVASDDLRIVLRALAVTVTPPAGGVGPNDYSASIQMQKVISGGPAEDLGMSPDGGELAVVRGPWSIDRYSTTDLSLVGRRTRSRFTPAAVAYGDAGWRVEVYNKDEEGSAQLLRPDGTVARTWTLSKGSELYHMFGKVGLDGKDAVALQYRSSTWTLHRLPLKLDSTLTVASKKVVGYRESFVLAVRRTGTSARKVTITAKPVDGEARVVGTIRLNQAGRGELKVSANRTTTFTASVGGDASHLPASKTRRVRVRGPVRFDIAGDHPVVDGYVRLKARETATLVTKIPRSQVGSCAYVTIQYKTSGRWRLLAGTDCMELPSTRVVKATFRAYDYRFARGKPIRMRGHWSGDAWYAGGQSPWTYARFG